MLEGQTNTLKQFKQNLSVSKFKSITVLILIVPLDVVSFKMFIIVIGN